MIYLIILFLLLFTVVYFLLFLKKDSDQESYYQRQKRMLNDESKKIKQELKEDSDLEDEFFNDLIKGGVGFILLGLLATVLFVVSGLFTDNKLYSFLGLFIITAVLYLAFLLPKDKL